MKKISITTIFTFIFLKARFPKMDHPPGITLATAMVSALSLRPVRKDVAMTGEITLRGNVLPVGGVKEKVLAARRARVSTIILPQQNRRDLDEVPKEPFKDIRFVFVDNMRQVFREALKEKAVPPVTSGHDHSDVPQAASGARRLELLCVSQAKGPSQIGAAFRLLERTFCLAQ